MVGPYPLDMRRMGKDGAGNILEPLPLSGEVVARVVADTADQLAMGGVNNQLSSVCHDRFQFVGTFSCCPQLAVHRRSN